MAMKAAKSIKELLKEAWATKAKVAAQAKKDERTAPILKNLAPPTMEILSFIDWRFKRLVKKRGKDKYGYSSH